VEKYSRAEQATVSIQYAHCMLDT